MYASVFEYPVTNHRKNVIPGLIWYFEPLGKLTPESKSVYGKSDPLCI